MKQWAKRIAFGIALLCAVVLLALLPVSFPSGGIAIAQINNPVIVIVASTPTSCSTLPLKIVTGTASLYGTNGSGGCTQIGGNSGAVTSVFTRTGAVVAAVGDYTAAQVTNALDLSNASLQTLTGSLAIPSGQSLNTPIIRDGSGNAAASLSSGRWTYASNGGLSTATGLYTGSPIATGGSGTSTWPLVLMQPSGTTTTTWNTAGTFLGVNAASSFTGNLVDFQFNGQSRASLSAGGTYTIAIVNGGVYRTQTNCSSAAAPAVCGSAAAGSVVIAAAGSSVVVDTTAVTATSQILIQDDSSLGTKLSVTCNTTLAPPQVTARTAGTSFTISTAIAPTSNPACYSYSIVN